MHAGDAAGATGVPVGVGDANQRVVTEKSVVNGPRVHGHPGQVPGCSRDAQALERFGVQVQEVPVEAVGEGDGVVGEPGDLLEVHPIGSDASDDDASAGGAEVDGCDRQLAVHRVRRGTRWW